MTGEWKRTKKFVMKHREKTHFVKNIANVFNTTVILLDNT